ncbi:MAG: acetyl-CoA hydrolase/transferase family protein [Saprospiraceae bacterium]|nr:acetyl-CoA hydrolase/transferase family protein [Saprospiraceae bacterium]
MIEKWMTADEAVKKVKSGDRVFLQGSAATPIHLIKALIARKSDLQNVELLSISTLGKDVFSDPDFGKHFYINSLFVSDNIRSLVNSHYGSYVPVFLSEIPILFDNKILELDVAFVHISPPDKHGFCSLGTSVDISVAAIRNAKYVIAQVNEQMPRTHGDGIIHLSKIDALVRVNEALPEVSYAAKITEKSLAIGRHIAELIDDRSTLQMGIGAIPDAVLSCLNNHKDLGVHTEMFSDGVISLVENGVITNKYKKKHPGKLVTGFAIGSRKLYDFVDDNPSTVFLDIGYVNDTKVIRSNPRVVAINSALEIDLTGQACSDSIGTYQYSGIGGQMDFMRGASLSVGGKPIIALNSTANNGTSKIVPFLRPGAGVVTTRGHMHYVVTEYGVAYLFGKNLKQRALALTEIAHPDHRESLYKAIFERFDHI